MNRFNVILLLSCILSLTSCSTTSTVKYSDFRPVTTTATIHDSMVTIHIGSDNATSEAWPRLKAKIKGQTIYVFGDLTLRKQSSEFVVWLPQSVDPQHVSVVWVDPDGSHITVPITK